MFYREARGMMVLAIIMPLGGLSMALLLPPLFELLGLHQATMPCDPHDVRRFQSEPLPPQGCWPSASTTSRVLSVLRAFVLGEGRAPCHKKTAGQVLCPVGFTAWAPRLISRTQLFGTGRRSRFGGASMRSASYLICYSWRGASMWPSPDAGAGP